MHSSVITVSLDVSTIVNDITELCTLPLFSDKLLVTNEANLQINRRVLLFFIIIDVVRLQFDGRLSVQTVQTNDD